MNGGLIIAILVLVGSVALGMPLAFAMGISSVFYAFIHGVNMEFICHKMFYSLYSFPLLAVPFFILAGSIMNHIGVTGKLFKFANNLVGHWKGGLGYVNILSSMFFAGMSGSALADIGGLGCVEMKGMRDQGYSDEFSIGITLASSIVGPIIPPSIPLVIYGSIVGESVGMLFLAGIIPGCLFGFVLAIGVYFYVRKYSDKVPKPCTKKSFVQCFRSFLEVLPSLVMPLMIVVSILAGVTTPTEAAVLAVVYSIFLGIVFHSINFSVLISAFKEAIINTVVVMFLITTASLFSWVITDAGITKVLVNFLQNFIDKPWLVLLLMNLILLVGGTVLEDLPLMILVTPIFLPIAKQIGIDPVHLGLIIVLNLMIGLYTPPYGVCLFMAKQTTGFSIKTIIQAMLPWLAPLILVLLITTYIPSNIFLFIPKYIFGIFH